MQGIAKCILKVAQTSHLSNFELSKVEFLKSLSNLNLGLYKMVFASDEFEPAT